SKFIGENGSQGIQGPAGPSGKTTYTWVKYADEKDGTGISDSPSGKMYIGLAFNKTTQTESTNPKDYQWSAMYDEEAFKGIGLADKTDILSGTEIYTDKADDDSVVHVEVDGKSVLQAPVGEGRNLFTEDSVRTWADASNAIGSSGNWKSFYVKAEPSTVYSLSRSSISNSRFRVYFLKDEPKIGMSLLGNEYGSFDDDLKVENFKTGEVKNWIFVYLDNAGNKLPDIKLEKGSTATPYTPAPEDVEDNIQSVNNFDIISQ